MAASQNTLANDRYREKLMEKLMEFLKSEQGGEQWVIQIANNSFGFPFVNDLGNDEVAKITISIPKGDRQGNAFDLYGEGEDYQINLKHKAEVKKKQEEAKAKKIEADRKKREAMAKLREQQAKEKEESAE